MFINLSDQQLENFLVRLGPPNENNCWPWLGCIHKRTGYGQVQINYKHYNIHRIVYLIFCGEIPNELYVLHECDFRACGNPWHLFLGTNQDNVIDAVNKKRHHGASKIYCKRGHEFQQSKYQRICQQCRTITQRERRKRILTAKFGVS